MVFRIPAPDGAHVAFAADLGFERDSSALAGVAAVNDRFVVVYLDELRPARGAPLKPSVVIDTFATTIKEYGCTEFVADAHYRATAKEHLEPHHLTFFDAPAGRDGKAETYLLARKLIHEGRVRLPNMPRLLAQLRAIVSRPMPGGGIQVTSPRRAGGGHGDLVSALVLALWRAHGHQHSGGDYLPPIMTFKSAFDDGTGSASFYGNDAPSGFASLDEGRNSQAPTQHPDMAQLGAFVERGMTVFHRQ